MALLSSVVIFGMVHARDGFDHFVIYCLNLFVTLVVAESMMIFISSISPVFMIGLAIGAGSLGIFMMVSGVYSCLFIFILYYQLCM